ncbi:MAG: carbamoyltransferase HypF [Thermoanaerobaculaceae bacterium]
MTRLRIVCRGVVQGVGFRPTVHRVATRLGLAGFVQNTPEGVVVEVEGPAAEDFVAALRHALPPLARLDEVSLEAVPARGEAGFEVRASSEGVRERALVPPDSALCAECRAEMEDPTDRRFRYPFTTCTACGPRFSLVRSLPYDRERTSMACFPLCPACRREYEDPSDRRFHAEPVCCPACGPRLWLVVGTGEEGVQTGARAPGGWAEALAGAREVLGRGGILAVKGLGGFQLACRADDEAAVARLRERKRRPSKPFAVMARDLDAARRLVSLSAADQAELTSARAPIVLAPRREGGGVAEGVAPGLEDLGVLLPTAPLHVELFRGAPFDTLVMTSGNVSDEPICRTNREALDRLGAIADAFLLHDRDVVRRVDDSVVRTGTDGPFAVRRARGLVPEALPLPATAPRPVLAPGGFLQASACLAAGPEAFFSQHVGDLDSEPARAFLREVVEGLEDFLQARGEVVVVDEHPDYPSTWLGEELARSRGAELVRVQHHLAHAAAVLAEWERFPSADEAAVAIALDGTGWGPDGTAWGGEWLALRGDLGWRRLASLQPLPLVGGEAAVREPWRVAAAALELAGLGAQARALPLGSLVESERLAQVVSLVRGGWPLASGAGRLFEALGALLGLVAVNGYEGEAAARAEALAATVWPASAWAEPRLGGQPCLPSAALLAAAARRLLNGEPAAAVAAGFHATFCRLAVELTRAVARPGVVALGGGCMVNRLLRQRLAEGLREAGFEPLLPRRVPPGDGGLAYGQAVLGVVATARGVRPRQEGAT